MECNSLFIFIPLKHYLHFLLSLYFKVNPVVTETMASTMAEVIMSVLPSAIPMPIPINPAVPNKASMKNFQLNDFMQY